MKNLFCVINVLILCFFSQTSFANVSEQIIQVSPSPLILTTSLLHIDNYHPRGINDLAASGGSIGLNGQFLSQQESIWIQGTYQADLDRFLLDDNILELDDSFAHYHIGLLTRFFLSNILYLDLSAAHTYKDELLGTGISTYRLGTSKKDTYERNSLGGKLSYGNFNGLQHLILAVDFYRQDYNDNNDYAQFSDLESQYIGLGYRLRLSDATHFDISIDFQNLSLPQENREDYQIYQALAGFSWQSTGKSRVMALLGAYQRKSSIGDSSQGVAWELAVNYQARENLALTINTSRESVVDNDQQIQDTLTTEIAASAIFQVKEHIKVIVKST